MQNYTIMNTDNEQTPGKEHTPTIKTDLIFPLWDEDGQRFFMDQHHEEQKRKQQEEAKKPQPPAVNNTSHSYIPSVGMYWNGIKYVSPSDKKQD